MADSDYCLAASFYQIKARLSLPKVAAVVLSSLTWVQPLGRVQGLDYLTLETHSKILSFLLPRGRDSLPCLTSWGTDFRNKACITYSFTILDYAGCREGRQHGSSFLFSRVFTAETQVRCIPDSMAGVQYVVLCSPLLRFQL